MQPETVIKGNIHTDTIINQGSSYFYLDQELQCNHLEISLMQKRAPEIPV